MKPEKLAVRAINQYRRRDILAYLGLRYYLDNDCAKNDIWAKDIAAHLVQTRESPAYYRSYHFKQMAENGVDVIPRNIYVPGANEIIAESALLYECSTDSAFQAGDCVYNYSFPDPSSKKGIFKNYFPGFQSRNDSIKEFCQSSSNIVVLYTDIKKFYPSISHELALQAWRSACDLSQLSTQFRDLGEKLLTQYARISKTHHEGLGLLTGPMFSHLIANLVLFEVDRKMSTYMEGMNGKYWRYVDDFVLAGNSEQIKMGRNQLGKILNDLGFFLHDEAKDFEVGSTEWLKETNNCNLSKSTSWRDLISNIKQFLLIKPEDRIDLERAFYEKEIRIPLLNYLQVVSESSFLETMQDRFKKYYGLLDKGKALTVDKLVTDALKARTIYNREINTLLEKNQDIQGYARKQLISKLRFYAKRLSYLATSETLASLSNDLAKYPELFLQSEVMRAIHSRGVSSLIKLGTNAIQAAAQILRIDEKPVTCSLHSFGEVERQGLAILRLNGIKIKFPENVDKQTTIDPLNQFALETDLEKLMKSDNLFIQEIACLHGSDKRWRHTDILDSAFDRDEDISFDIIDQLQVSSYF